MGTQQKVNTETSVHLTALSVSDSTAAAECWKLVSKALIRANKLG